MALVMLMVFCDGLSDGDGLCDGLSDGDGLCGDMGMVFVMIWGWSL